MEKIKKVLVVLSCMVIFMGLIVVKGSASTVTGKFVRTVDDGLGGSATIIVNSIDSVDTTTYNYINFHVYFPLNNYINDGINSEGNYVSGTCAILDVTVDGNLTITENDDWDDMLTGNITMTLPDGTPISFSFSFENGQQYITFNGEKYSESALNSLLKINSPGMVSLIEELHMYSKYSKVNIQYDITYPNTSGSFTMNYEKNITNYKCISYKDTFGVMEHEIIMEWTTKQDVQANTAMLVYPGSLSWEDAPLFYFATGKMTNDKTVTINDTTRTQKNHFYFNGTISFVDDSFVQTGVVNFTQNYNVTIDVSSSISRGPGESFSYNDAVNAINSTTGYAIVNGNKITDPSTLFYIEGLFYSFTTQSMSE